MFQIETRNLSCTMSCLNVNFSDIEHKMALVSIIITMDTLPQEKLVMYKNQINLDPIEIIQFSLKIYDLLKHLHLWVGVWVG